MVPSVAEEGRAMILPAQSVTCDRCGRPDWLLAASPQEARALLVSEGWDVEHEDVCGSCLAEEGVPLRVIASDYIPPCETGPDPTDWGNL